jgi:hypothetical protein
VTARRDVPVRAAALEKKLGHVPFAVWRLLLDGHDDGIYTGSAGAIREALAASGVVRCQGTVNIALARLRLACLSWVKHVGPPRGLDSPLVERAVLGRLWGDYAVVPKWTERWLRSPKRRPSTRPLMRAVDDDVDALVALAPEQMAVEDWPPPVAHGSAPNPAPR